jgi:hypothetical protein
MPSPLIGISFPDAMWSEDLFGPWFMPRRSWAAWRTFAKALFGLPMLEREVKIFQARTGRMEPPTIPAREAWVPVGRRGGKSRFMSAIATYMACCRDYDPYLAPGEWAFIPVLAADKIQAKIVFDYISAFFEHIPLLQGMIRRKGSGKGLDKGAEHIALTNRVIIRVQVASYRRVRGRTIACAICDEIAYWMTGDSLNPDNEIITALKPGMLTIPGAVLLAISSPYRRAGTLWSAYRDHWAKEHDRVLVWKGPTLSMNATADREEIAKAYEADPDSARAEYGAEFREDLETYVSPETVQAVTVADRQSLPYAFDDDRGRTYRYVAFCDPSGGSGGDSMTLAIVRRDTETGRGVVCRLEEIKPPFDPAEATKSYADILNEYGLAHVEGDHYGGDWPKSEFRKHGIVYEICDLDKSHIYNEFLPLLNKREVELLDNRKANAQLCALERRTGPTGTFIISHPNVAGAHDDLVNSVAGALVRIMKRRGLEGYGAEVTPMSPSPTMSESLPVPGASSSTITPGLDELLERRRARETTEPEPATPSPNPTEEYMRRDGWREI